MQDQHPAHGDLPQQRGVRQDLPVQCTPCKSTGSLTKFVFAVRAGLRKPSTSLNPKPYMPESLGPGSPGLPGTSHAVVTGGLRLRVALRLAALVLALALCRV